MITTVPVEGSQCQCQLQIKSSLDRTRTNSKPGRSLPHPSISCNRKNPLEFFDSARPAFLEFAPWHVDPFDASIHVPIVPSIHPYASFPWPLGIMYARGRVHIIITRVVVSRRNKSYGTGTCTVIVQCTVQEKK